MIGVPSTIAAVVSAATASTSVTTTWWPRRARRSAIFLPSPRPAPVTTATGSSTMAQPANATAWTGGRWCETTARDWPRSRLAYTFGVKETVATPRPYTRIGDSVCA